MPEPVPFRFYPDNLKLNFGNSLMMPDAWLYSDGANFNIKRGSGSVADLLIEMGCKWNQSVDEYVQFGADPEHRTFADTADCLCAHRVADDTAVVVRAIQAAVTVKNTASRSLRANGIQVTCDVAGTAAVTAAIGSARLLTTVRTEANGQTLSAINANECQVSWESNSATAIGVDVRDVLCAEIQGKGGALTNAVGLYCQAHTITTGSLTNAYGAYVEKQTAGGARNAGVFLKSTGNKLMFAAATEYIESTVAGHLDLAANVSIDMNADIDIADGQNVIVATGTGSKIATSASQKLGFFGATPVAKQLKANHNNWAAVSDVVAALVNLGLFNQV